MLRLGIRHVSFLANHLSVPELTRLPAPRINPPITNGDKVHITVGAEPDIEAPVIEPDELFDAMEGSSSDPQENEDVSTKKNQYIVADQMATIKSEGCAPVKSAQGALMKYLQRRSAMKSSLSTLSVTLFNFHDTSFAEHLIRKNIGSLVIAESAYNHAKNAKGFAKSQKKQFRQVEAFHAELSALLGIGRKKLARFPKQLLGEKAQRNPLIVSPSRDIDESGNKYLSSPVLISTLPIPTYQQQVLTALQNNLLLHYNKTDDATIFQYGVVELLTFLDLRTISHLLCGVDSKLSFYSHSHRRHSELMNKLFTISPLSVKGYGRKLFSPNIPKSEKRAITHEKKLLEQGWDPSLMYAVSIKPSTDIRLAGQFLDGAGDCLTSTALMSFTYWLTMVGRQPHAKKASAIFRSLAPESAHLAHSFVDEQQSIGDLSLLDLERVFVKLHQEIEISSDFTKFASSVTVKRHIS